MKTSCVADPGVMLNVEEVAGVYVGRARGREGVAGADLVDGERREGRDPRGNRRRAAGQGAAARVGPDGQADVVLLSPVSTLPLESSTATVTAGEIAEPACALEGCWMNTSCVADPGVMLNVEEVAGVYVGVLEAVRV